MPSKQERAVVAYLERYGQPQTLAAINDHLAGQGYEPVDLEALAGLVDANSIAYADGGVDSYGQEINLYAPIGYKA